MPKFWVTVEIEADSDDQAVAKLPVLYPTREVIPVPDDLWDEDPAYSRSDWEYEVSNGDTILGYWSWVQHQQEAAEEDDKEKDDDDEG